MFFGINVGSSIYYVGPPCYLVPFFSNVAVHLEKRKRGSRFPFLIKELYDGILPYEHVSQVAVIGKEAFCSCFHLEQIQLPPNLKKIEDKVFSACFELTEVVITEGVETIGEEAFADCTKLSVITIPASVMGISAAAFRKTKKHLMIEAPSGSAAAKYAKKYKIESCL